MGSISLEQLFPDHFGDPDDAGPISPMRMPLEAWVMRAGFEPHSRGEIVFEGETRVGVRFSERLWRYKQKPDTATERSARRWRLEFWADAGSAAPLAPGHTMVIAQEPYANAWLQSAAFKMYTKKSEEERPMPVVDELKKDEDPVDWLERHAPHDPWEHNARYVAGISQPRGFFSDKPRNSAGDLVLGVCPNLDELVKKIMDSSEIQHLLSETLAGRLRYWYPGVVPPPPHPCSEVLDDCPMLMAMAVQQALAGPRKLPEKWIGQPVWKLADMIYRDHVNQRDRAVRRRPERVADAPRT